MISWSDFTVSRILGGAVILVAVAGMSHCIDYLNELDEQNTAIRDANGGVIPGKEAIDNEDKRYTVRTIIHNGNEYTCFSAGHQMGCAKE